MLFREVAIILNQAFVRINDFYSFISLQISSLFREVAIILSQAFTRISDFYSFIKRQATIFLFDIAGKRQSQNIVDFCMANHDGDTLLLYIEKNKQKYFNRFARLANTREKPAYFLKSLNPLPKTAIVEFFLTENQLITFLVLPGEKSPNPSKGLCWQLKNSPLETLPQEWISKLTAKTKKDNETDETLEYLPTTIDQISNLLNFKNLLKYIPSEINHLTIIPHKYLHLFPIHALWINDTERLIDRFSIQYFPNLKVWNICQNRNRDRWEFIGIENPTQDKDLIFAKAEISTIGKCQLFNKTDIFSGQKATKSTILTTANNYHCLHFSGHAEYNYKNPLDSYLMLSDKPDENLTLNTILKDLKMPHTDLVTLSACCTGVVDVFQPTDEYLGLATGFLLVGAKAVIGSLWKVNSIATAFLLDEFYRQLGETENKALALQRAQNWLRRRSAEELRERAKTWDLTMLESTERTRLRAALKSLKGVPFENPYYWAAFILTGC